MSSAPESPTGSGADRSVDPAEDVRWLDRAALLALRAAGHVEPNPMVGAIIVRDGRVIGMGHHTRFGALHAEREALADCARRGESPEGATVYCTLEPCSHHGKQPPCTEALVEAGVSRVVFAREDPNEEASGGAQVLRNAGIEAEMVGGSALAERCASAFVKRVKTGLPWVSAKWAQTIDGRIATRTGESQWISGPSSRRRVHKMRARMDAMVTGIGTVLADDPMLTPRGVVARRVPRRVVIDSDLDIPLDCRLVATAREVPTTVVCAQENLFERLAKQRREALTAAGVEVLGVLGGTMSAGWLDLAAALRLLVERHDVSNVMVESGPGLLGSMLEAGLIDEAVVYVAPLLLGDEHAKAAATGRVAASLSSGLRFDLARVKRVGEDVELTYRRREAR
ncbi:MAG: bifunctional diaminohydroxyphosphoribosylaminopyrimidine deaminase/5-amino-6-(5-phosphoribosylamino)uracil reductase RibD [Planctomycetota bacterium]